MKKFVPLLFLIVIAAMCISSCDAAPEISTSPPKPEQENNLTTELDPLPDPATPTPTPPIPQPPNVNPFPKDAGNQYGSSPGYNPGEWQIATPLHPSFQITRAEMLFCDEQWYVVTEVKNNGPYYFQWISFVVHHGGYTYYHYNWEMPWRPEGTTCYLPDNGLAVLPPGETRLIHFPITPIHPEVEYDITIWQCTYSSIPDSCPSRNFLLNQNIWAVMEIPDIYMEEVALCWVGPGPYYEVVNSIPKDTEVELLGIGDVEGYFVVQEPKYQRACWLQSEFASEVPEEFLRTLQVFETPLFPEGVVRGRVFKDQDGNGAFDGSDVGLPNAQVSLAPGSCSNYGGARTTTSDGDGWYSFSDVEPGSYCLYMSKPNTCKKFSTANGFDLSVDWASVIDKNFGFEGCR